MNVIPSSIEANQTSGTTGNLLPITVIFPYTLLKVTGSAMEKKLNKFHLFFDVCGGLPLGKCKCFVSL